MSNIEISIWGIRAGFVESGIYHSKNIPEIRELQEDIYRPLANKARPHDTFMIHRTRNNTMVSLLFTNRVKEYSASGAGRDGYIVFSLIIPKGFAFTASPRKAMQEMAAWYLVRQADKKNNNFTGNQLNEFVQSLALKSVTIHDKSGKKFTRVDSDQTVDNLLCADNTYAAFNELILIQNSVDFPVVDLPHQKVDLVIEKKKNDDENELLAKRKKEQERVSAEVKKIEADLANLLSKGETTLAIAQFDSFEHRNSIGGSVKTRIDREKDAISRSHREAQVAKEQGELADQIKSDLKKGNVKSAFLMSSRLKDKKLLSFEQNDQIRAFGRAKDKKEQTARREREQAEQKKKKKKMILFGGIGLVVLLLALSFFMEIPTSFYDADGDGIANSCDLCSETADGADVDENGCADSDGDGVIDDEDMCDDTPNGAVVSECCGCPDTDGDGVFDNLDLCDSTEAGLVVDKFGCVDSDKDGVSDSKDQCDSTKLGTKVDANGCPIDEEGAIDKKEQIEKLKKGESVDMPGDAESALEYKKVRIKDNKWEYQPDENGPFMPVSSQKSYDYLNKHFSQSLKLETETIGDPVVPVPVPVPNPDPPTGGVSAEKKAEIKVQFDVLTAKYEATTFTKRDKANFKTMTTPYWDDLDIKSWWKRVRKRSTID